MFILKFILYKGSQKMTIKQYKNPPKLFLQYFWEEGNGASTKRHFG